MRSDDAVEERRDLFASRSLGELLVGYRANDLMPNRAIS